MADEPTGRATGGPLHGPGRQRAGPAHRKFGHLPFDIEVRGGGGTLCPTHRHDPPHSLAGAPWISSATIHLGREVGRLLVGNRRIDAPEQRRIVVAWMTTQAARGTRPLIVALGRDGTELSRLGPHDSLDTHTWARLREEL